MSNMSYCRFENTLHDLQDCYDNVNDDLSESEVRARDNLIALCRDFADIEIEEKELPEYDDNPLDLLNFDKITNGEKDKNR